MIGMLWAVGITLVAGWLWLAYDYTMLAIEGDRQARILAPVVIGALVLCVGLLAAT